MIAATLANGGVNPRHGRARRARGRGPSVLSVMTTCGMYDGAGEWLVSVGMPAKSGVSGGVLGVLPGRLGIAVFSPRLDERGNSVRGVSVCRDLSHDLALHLVRPGEQAAAPVRASYVLGERASKRQRTAAQRAAIRGGSRLTAIFELQGELGFVAAESVSRSLAARPAKVELVVLDLRRVIRADRAGLEFLPALARPGRGGRPPRPRGRPPRARGRRLGDRNVRPPGRGARVVRGRAAGASRPRRRGPVGSGREAPPAARADCRGAREPSATCGDGRGRTRPGACAGRRPCGRALPRDSPAASASTAGPAG